MGLGKGKTMHESDGAQLATTHLATNVTFHYVERSDRKREAIKFVHGYSDP